MSIGIFVSKNSHILQKTKYKTHLTAITNEINLLHINAFSMFIIGPLNKSKISMDVQAINMYCIDNNIEVWPHASYISSGIWNVNKENRYEKKSLMYLCDIRDHLVIGRELKAKGISFHLPRHTINSVIETMEIISNCKEINEVRSPTTPLFLLEMPASKSHPDLTYETPNKLNTLVDKLTRNKKITLPFALNIDTCHQFASGVSFSQIGSWDDWTNALTSKTRKLIKLIHLNGANGKNFGTGKDGHEIPLSSTDSIWGHLISDEFRAYLNNIDNTEANRYDLYKKLSSNEKKIIKSSSFNELVQWSKVNNVSMIIEINRGKYVDVKFVIDVVRNLLQ